MYKPHRKPWPSNRPKSKTSDISKQPLSAVQISFTRRCVPFLVHGCIEETLFNSLYIFIVKEYPSKVDRWRENLNRQNWKPDYHIKGHIWSACRNTLTTTNLASYRFSSMTSNFLDNTRTKIKNAAFKTSQMDQIALEYWYYGFLGRLRVDGRGFLHQTPILKNRSPEQKSSCRTCAEAFHSPFKLKTYYCIVFIEFHHPKLYHFHSLSLGFILKIFLKFRKFQPRYSSKIYSYIKRSVLRH